MAKKNNETQSPKKNLQDLLREEFGKRYIESVQMPECFGTALNPAMKLRPYQEECFRYFRTYWENSFEAKSYPPQLLFHMATGSGKTLIMAGAMLYLYEKGYRNFLFFVNSTNIIEKTKENFTNQASPKYLFAPQISVNQKRVEIKLVDNFQGIADDCINLCLTTTQGLHSSLNNPKENGITYDDFVGCKIVLISDEAHHINTATRKGKKVAGENPMLFELNDEYSDDWETTVMRIFNSNNGSTNPNILLEFTATADLSDENIAEKYAGKIIFDYPLKKFRKDGYSKDIEVVQSDLSPIDRAIQTVLLNQYKRKLFAAINQDIKPVMMLKSKTIKDNKAFYDDFTSTIKHLKAADIAKLRAGAKGDIKEAFGYFDELGIRIDNLLLEIKEDFKEENLLLVDGNTITSEKQLKLNSLEAKDNEFRAVFAVDMLNEGWDVLNLFDIVRLYETRDASNNKPGKTTMQEAQLIGRGARYMPFDSPEGDKPKGERKYDSDITNRLRVVEKLHYHSSHNPRYVAELQTAMEETGIVAKRSKEINLKLKDSFKKSSFYNDGYVFVNEKEKEPYVVNEELTSLGEKILNQSFKVRIKSGEMRSSLVFEKASNEDLTTLSTRTIRMNELGENVIRAAINRFDTYKFSELKGTLINLKSIKEFINSNDYLANLSITIYGREEVLKNISQTEKLNVVVEVLKQLEVLLPKLRDAYRGTKHFIAKPVKDTFKDHVLKISLDGSEDKEFGKSMAESSNISFTTDLEKCKWYAYNDCYGTSEEKFLVKYIESIYGKLSEKYEDVYLLRNEKDVRIYSFVGGNTFEPDFLLFMKKRDEYGVYDNIQLFIEPKGEHLIKNDSWKEEFMLEIKDKADKLFTAKTSKYSIWGLPFFTESKKSIFDKSMQEQFSV